MPADSYDPRKAAETLANLVSAVIGGNRVPQGGTIAGGQDITDLGGNGTGGGDSGSGDYGAGFATGSREQDAFYVAVLKGLGLPVSEGNMQLMRAWNQAEGMDAGYNNPFATTQGGPGTKINSVGVMAYSSFDAGVQATIQTLQNGRYQGILDGLARSDPAATAQAIADSPWGTGSLVSRVLGSGAGSNPTPYASEASPAPAAPPDAGYDPGFPVM